MIKKNIQKGTKTYPSELQKYEFGYRGVVKSNKLTVSENASKMEPKTLPNRSKIDHNGILKTIFTMKMPKRCKMAPKWTLEGTKGP